MAGGGPGIAGAAAAGPETREHLFKVLVIGELGVGKTSVIKRYVHQLFSQHYRATIGVDFALKVLNWDSRTLVRLQLWDIAGQERFGNMTRVYYKEAVGAFVVFDISRGSTFEAVLKWKSDLDAKVHLPNGKPIPVVLLANKCDQKRDNGHSPSQMDQFCKDHGFAGWFETSAKDNINIDEAARFLVENILANDQRFPSEENDVDKIKLSRETFTEERRSQCC
ncbi:ras-related protein Rab-32 [Ctenodactylus gundi]